ncbi:MAG: hypothetical protein NWE93_10860 [Candidatus Bathyarchaeota archaeon]|nr:hypothetical protein [Candidatus Bathyarchaeota archaeon]
MPRAINYIALTAGILTVVLVAVSAYVPWWQFNVGNPSFATVNFSPVNFNFSLFGSILTVPLIWALNLAALLTLLSGGITLLIYSVIPTKSYAKTLLSFGYKKPLYALILFVVSLLIMYFSVTLLSGFNFPLMGAGEVGLPAGLAPGGVNIRVEVSSAFLFPFYLAIVVAALCIIARVYHRKVVPPAAPAAPASSPQTPAPTPAPAPAAPAVPQP